MIIVVTSLLDTIAYTYENEDFKEALTSYDGEIITYDELGNPLNYLGKTMTWANFYYLPSS